MMDGSVGGSNSPAPFLTKTYDMLEDPSTNSIVAWDYSAKSFIVWDPLDFARDSLPKYFKHNNFSSFVRQLNTYGFRKVDPDRWEFANDEFIRGKKHLLKNIRRRRPIHSHSLQHGSLTEAERRKLQDEIEKLKRDKAMLFSDLQQNLQQRREIGKQIESFQRRLKVMKHNEQNMMTILEQVMERSMASSLISNIVVSQSENQGKKRSLSKSDLFCQDVVDMDEDNKMIVAFHPSNDIAAPMLDMEPFEKMESTLYSLEKLIWSASQASGEVFPNGIIATDIEMNNASSGDIDVNMHPCFPSSLVDSLEIAETVNQMEITPSNIPSTQTQTQTHCKISEIDVNSEPPLPTAAPASSEVSDIGVSESVMRSEENDIFWQQFFP